MGFFDFFIRKNSSRDTFLISFSSNLPIGMEVNLWTRPDTYTVHIYQRGTIGGEGLLGEFDNTNIAKHIAQRKRYKAFVESSNKLKIILINDTIEESFHRSYLESGFSKVKEDMKKKVRIKQIDFNFYSDGKFLPNIGDKVYPKYFEDIEEHIKTWKINLSFINQNNIIIGTKESEPSKAKQILRVHFANKQKLDCTVQKIIYRSDYYEIYVLATII